MNAKEALELSKVSTELIIKRYTDKVLDAIQYNIKDYCENGRTRVIIDFFKIPTQPNAMGDNWTGVKGLKDAEVIVANVKAVLEADGYSLTSIRGKYETEISWEE